MEENKNEDLLINDDEYPAEMLSYFDEMRHKTYTFSTEFLRSNYISNSITFKIGDLPLKDLQVIENHFYKNKCIARYNFKFPFCVPNSVNNWEYIYEIPQLDSEMINDLISNGQKLTSDTYFFAKNKLILHNKSEYYFKDN